MKITNLPALVLLILTSGLNNTVEVPIEPVKEAPKELTKEVREKVVKQVTEAKKTEPGMLSEPMQEGPVLTPRVARVPFKDCITLRSIDSVELNSTGDMLLTGSKDNVRLWDVKTCERILSLDTSGFAKFIPGDDRLITRWLNKIMIWETGTENLLNTIDVPSKIISFSADGSKVITAPSYGSAVLWNTATGKPIMELRHPGSQQLSVQSAMFNPVNNTVATGSSDFAVRLWDADTSELLHVLQGHDDIVNRVAFNAQGDKLITGSWDGTAKVWDASTGRLLSSLKGHHRGIIDVDLSPDDTKAATASADSTAMIWDVATGDLLHAFPHKQRVLTSKFSPDGTKLLTVSGYAGSGEAMLWDVKSGELIAIFDGPRSMFAAQFNRAGDKVVTASEEGVIRIWNISGL